MDKKLESFSKAEIIQAIRKVPKYLTHGTSIEEIIIDQADCLKREEIFAEADKAKEIVRKETAEKFAEMVKERKVAMKIDGVGTCIVFVGDIDEICKELTEGKG